jgi:hypothetical protein
MIAAAFDLEVGRLEIAMDDAFPVRSIEGIGNLSCVVKRGLERQRPRARIVHRTVQRKS